MSKLPRDLKNPDFRLAFLTVHHLDPQFLAEWAGLNQEIVFWAVRYCHVMAAIDVLRRTLPDTSPAVVELTALADRLFERHDLKRVAW